MAAKQGGDLPTLHEQSLLFANVKSQFQKSNYWSAQTHKSDPSWAWAQGFEYGGQGNAHKGYKFHARAVRRVPI